MTATIFVAWALLFPVFVAVRLPFALVLAFVAGLAHLVPRIGPLLGLVPALVIGTFISPTTAGLALLGGGVAQYIAHTLGMRALRTTRVNVNPLLQVLLLMALVQLAGVWAMVLAPPLAAMIQELYPHLVARPAPTHLEHEELSQLESELETLAGEIPPDDRELSGALKRSSDLMVQARDIVVQP
jgi:predicted PurR-regulated permease PerM